MNENNLKGLLDAPELLTPVLCDELVKEGFKQTDLDIFIEMGFAFNRERNSFVSFV
jgi:hypothetical protein